MKGTIEVVGLSLSRCVRDLALGLVPLASVKKVIGGTAYKNLDDLWKEYSPSVWKDCLPAAQQILLFLIAQQRFDQPRLRGETPPDSAGGIWQVGDLVMDTPELQDLLSLSDFFLQLSQGGRNHLLDYLPKPVVERFLREANTPRLAQVFSDLPDLAGSKPVDEVYAMVIARLKDFYQRATDVEKMVMHPAVINILKPFLQHKMAKARTKPRQPAGFSYGASQVGRMVDGRFVPAGAEETPPDPDPEPEPEGGPGNPGG